MAEKRPVTRIVLQPHPDPYATPKTKSGVSRESGEIADEDLARCIWNPIHKDYRSLAILFCFILNSSLIMLMEVKNKIRTGCSYSSHHHMQLG